jgi:cell division septation protein DedD
MTADQYPKEKGETGHIKKPGEHDYAQPEASGDAPPGESAVFSELNRLARESKSSWSDFAPTPKSDRNFLRLIIIAIILISGVTLVVGYRSPASLNLNFLAEKLSQVSEYLFTGNFTSNDENPVMVEENSKQQTKITALESQVAGLKANEAQFKSRIAELEVSAQPTRVLSEPPSVDSDMTPRLQRTSPTTEPKSEPEAEPEPEPELRPALTDKTPIQPAVETAQFLGDWFINVGTFSDRAAAETLLAKVQTILKTAQLQEVRVNNRLLHRIRASGYASQSSAQDQAQRLHSEFGLNTWVAKEK